MDRSTLITQARNVLNETTASFWTDAELQQWLNWAIRELAAIVRIQSNATTTGNTVNGTSTLNLAAGVVRIVAVRLNTDPLVRTMIEELVANDADLAATGTPSHYYLTRTAAGLITVNWWPTPDKAYAYTIWTVNELADLSADGDSPALPARHHHKLLLPVWGFAYAKGGRDYPASTGYFAAWEQAKREIVADLINVQEDGYVVRYVDPEASTVSRTFNPLQWP